MARPTSGRRRRAQAELDREASHPRGADVMDEAPSFTITSAIVPRGASRYRRTPRGAPQPQFNAFSGHLTSVSPHPSLRGFAASSCAAGNNHEPSWTSLPMPAPRLSSDGGPYSEPRSPVLLRRRPASFSEGIIHWIATSWNDAGDDERLSGLRASETRHRRSLGNPNSRPRTSSPHPPTRTAPTTAEEAHERMIGDCATRGGPFQ